MDYFELAEFMRELPSEDHKELWRNHNEHVKLYNKYKGKDMENTTGIGPIMAKLIKRLNQLNTNDATELRILYEIYEGNSDDGRSDLVKDLNSLVNEYYDHNPSVVSYCKQIITLLDKSPSDKDRLKKIAEFGSEILKHNIHNLPDDFRWRIEMMISDILAYFSDEENSVLDIEDLVEEILEHMECRDEYRIYELMKEMREELSDCDE